MPRLTNAHIRHYVVIRKVGSRTQSPDLDSICNGVKLCSSVMVISFFELDVDALHGNRRSRNEESFLQYKACCGTIR
uniref:Uncharacterized protein n=1 Tax=Lepeophtheirus salmonis TaxID=72036 RepID=A0A0K2TZ78_LEPSM